MENSELIAVVGIVISIVTAFFTAKFVVNKEKSQGKTILLEITKRYFVACLNSWDMKTNKLKNEKIDKLKYLRIAKGIDKELNELVKNPYYAQILKKYPDLTMLHIQIISEIEENEQSTSIILEQGTALKMHKLYAELKKGIGKKLLKNKSFKGLDELINNYMNNKMD
jgi:hypothetical protein